MNELFEHRVSLPRHFMAHQDVLGTKNLSLQSPRQILLLKEQGIVHSHFTLKLVFQVVHLDLEVVDDIDQFLFLAQEHDTNIF